ncbi:hypothetical protein [Pontivivens ytuae]|uniref:Uncharacterized protein n=1 Tax=Pontivivens ytuae TaxID=2789856 RepID=A0A7S9LRQ4_9RHOB|nr:hypothetical protein [Pontivivens ytuae]QPH53869.1 hypothetical protein I0K15_19170 [Pontivivens ytuae]
MEIDVNVAPPAQRQGLVIADATLSRLIAVSDTVAQMTGRSDAPTDLSELFTAALVHEMRNIAGLRSAQDEGLYLGFRDVGGVQLAVRLETRANLILISLQSPVDPISDLADSMLALRMLLRGIDAAAFARGDLGMLACRNLRLTIAARRVRLARATEAGLTVEAEAGWMPDGQGLDPANWTRTRLDEVMAHEPFRHVAPTDVAPPAFLPVAPPGITVEPPAWPSDLPRPEADLLILMREPVAGTPRCFFCETFHPAPLPFSALSSVAMFLRVLDLLEGVGRSADRRE